MRKKLKLIENLVKEGNINFYLALNSKSFTEILMKLLKRVYLFK